MLICSHGSDLRSYIPEAANQLFDKMYARYCKDDLAGERLKCLNLIAGESMELEIQECETIRTKVLGENTEAGSTSDQTSSRRAGTACGDNPALEDTTCANTSQRADTPVCKQARRINARSTSGLTNVTFANTSPSEDHPGTKIESRGFDIMKGPILHYTKAETLEEGVTQRLPYFKCPVEECSKIFNKVHNINQHL